MIIMVMERLATLASQVYLNQDANTLVWQTLERGQGTVSDTGALCIRTGKFTGRSPKDRFIVRDECTENSVDWGEINIPISTEIFRSEERRVGKECQSW